MFFYFLFLLFSASSTVLATSLRQASLSSLCPESPRISVGEMTQTGHSTAASVAAERYLTSPSFSPLTTLLLLECFGDPSLSQQARQLQPECIARLYWSALGNQCGMDGAGVADPSRSVHDLCRAALEQSGLVPTPQPVQPTSHAGHPAPTRHQLLPIFVARFAQRRHTTLQLHRSARRAEWESQLFLLRAVARRTKSHPDSSQ